MEEVSRPGFRPTKRRMRLGAMASGRRGSGPGGVGRGLGRLRFEGEDIDDGGSEGERLRGDGMDGEGWRSGVDEEEVDARSRGLLRRGCWRGMDFFCSGVKMNSESLRRPAKVGVGRLSVASSWGDDVSDIFYGEYGVKGALRRRDISH